jgi:hypothetical protein
MGRHRRPVRFWILRLLGTADANSAGGFYNNGVYPTARRKKQRSQCRGVIAVELHLNRFLRTFGAGESAYTLCEPADEVLRRTITETQRARLKKDSLAATSPGV